MQATHLARHANVPLNGYGSVTRGADLTDHLRRRVGRKDTAIDPSLELDRFAKMSVAELAHSRSTPLIPQWAQIVDVTLDAYQRALLGQLQPKPALDHAAEQIDAFLKRS